MSAKDVADRLMRRGYRVVSRRGRIVSRVDREDWQEFALSGGYPVCSDWYRRCLSEDNRVVSQQVIRLMKTSSNDPIGYICNTQEN